MKPDTELKLVKTTRLPGVVSRQYREVKVTEASRIPLAVATALALSLWLVFLGMLGGSVLSLFLGHWRVGAACAVCALVALFFAIGANDARERMGKK